MGVVTNESESTSVVPPARLFQAFVLNSDTLLPKVLPETIKSSEIIEGDGGAGSIRKITFAEGRQLNFVKHKIEAIDKENFCYSYSLIEGDSLLDALEKISYETKFVASPDGGSIIKSTSKYYTKGDIEINEEKIKAGKEKGLGLFKAVEAYLLANPDA